MKTNVNVWRIIWRQNQNTHSIIFFFTENRDVYEIMSKNMLEPERSQMEIWRRVAWWISKATRAQAHVSDRALIPTHKFVILITFPH
jgi:hypothetical protein